MPELGTIGEGIDTYRTDGSRELDRLQITATPESRIGYGYHGIAYLFERHRVGNEEISSIGGHLRQGGAHLHFGFGGSKDMIHNMFCHELRDGRRLLACRQRLG